MAGIGIESRVTEWSDLPIELQSMIVDLCDYSTRCRLRAASFSLKHLADTAKLFIPSVKICEKRKKGIQLTFTFSSDAKEYLLKYYSIGYCQTRIKQLGKQTVIVDGKNPDEVASDFFKRCCVQKNVTIGHLILETVEDTPWLYHNHLFSSSEILQVEEIYWNKDGDSELAWTILQRCRPELLKDIKVEGYNVFEIPLFEMVNVKAFKNLQSLEILAEVDAVDEDVLALNASQIHLESNKFSGKLVNEMVKKWVRENKKDSFFLLKGVNSDELTTTGFEPIPSLVGERISAYRMTLPNDNFIFLKKGSKGVSAEIKNQPFLNNSRMDRQRERCLKSLADCCCDPNVAPHYRADDSDYDNYSDRDSDNENEYGYGF